MGVIKSVPENCRYCFGCIRICPVKALRSVEDRYFDVIQERCLSCGLCVGTCTQSALLYEDSVETVRDLLEHKQTLLVLATEYIASFYPYKPEVIVGAFEEAGFFVVEDSLLAEEIVAREYLANFRKSEATIIRSTCPVVVEYVERFYPELIPHLAPVVSPMVAAGRLYKEIYGHDIAVVYATPCVAAKAEAKEENVRDAVDAVITFEEAKRLLNELEINLDYVKPSSSELYKPAVIRRYSAPGGFPRQILADFKLIDKDIKVVKGFDELKELFEGFKKNIINPKVIDTLFCSTCIDGPGMATSLGVVARKKIVEEFYAERAKSSRRVTLDQLLPRLPYFETKRIFRYKVSDMRKPTEEEIAMVLAQGERDKPENMLDCGSCGYETCYEHAVAIFYGFSNWSRCIPYQRAVYSRVLKQLKEASTTDGLTGLYNHRAFLDRLEQEFYRAQRYGTDLSVLLIDVDGFKQVNDTYGHLVGDEVLKKIAKMLKDNVRTSDFVARYGGDEFAVILPETSSTEALAVAEKLRRNAERQDFKINSKIVKLTLSIGISTLSAEHRSFFDMIEEADKAMYKAKENGKNTICSGTEKVSEISKATLDELEILNSLEKEIFGEQEDI